MDVRSLRQQLLIALALAVGCDSGSYSSASVDGNVTSPPIPEIDAVGVVEPARREVPAPPEIPPGLLDLLVGTRPVPVPDDEIAAPDCWVHPNRPGCGDPPPDPCFDCLPDLPRPNRGRPFGDRLADLVGDAGTDEGARWARYALAEHASVAAFARHTLELLALGAPLELIEAVGRAQADEVRHAAVCLAMARVHGADVEIGPLDTGLPPSTTLFDVLAGVASEGCVAEALSVWSMLDDLETEADPQARAVLESLVQDEMRHAELAWRTMRWGFPQLGEAEQDAILALLDERPDHVPVPDFEVVVARHARALLG
ncbi:MAG: hypothetical protein R3F61_06305 [Myxococcota bacterium]